MDFVSGFFYGGASESPTVIKYLSLIIFAIIVIITCLIAFYISKKVVKFILPKYIKKSKAKLDDILYDNNFYDKAAHLVPVVIIYIVFPFFKEYADVIKLIADTYLTVVLVQILASVLDSVDELYKTYEVSKTRPITAILQIVKAIIYIIATILIVANLLGEKPLAFLGGIGALSAVFSLIFKDPILGFVGGIQLTSNDMLRVGDWIKVPKYDAEGTVTEISLTTISIRAFDRTTVRVPNYSLLTDSFVNYRGMHDAGGRRFKRIIYIDLDSIRQYTREELEKLKNIDYLNDYIKEQEEKKNASTIKMTSNNDENKKFAITNLEIFRVCAQNYLDNHPRLHKGMPIMVRQFTPEGEGMPVEIYAFTDTTVWAEYEALQAQVFDDIYFLVSEFGLKIYQKPSGSDIKQVMSKDS